jgi:transcriptional regulator with XRE-family HTH domain
MRFGVELRRRRVAAGLSLRGLAKLVHFEVSHLSRIENGTRRAGLDLARQCDEVLGAGGDLAALADPLVPAPVRPPAHTGSPLDVPETLADDPASRDALLQMFRHLRGAGQRTAPALIMPALLAQTATVSDLAARADDRARRDLFVLAAHHAEYVGWMLQEHGDPAAALTWIARAVELDRQAGRADMAAYALVRRAELALYRDRPTEVITLAGQAQEIAGVYPRITALAAQREAQGHARAGDRSRCEAALARSAEQWPGGAATDLFGSSSVPDLHTMVTAWCDVDLGRPDHAAERMTGVLESLPAGARRARTLLAARLAVAHALRGDLQSSCAMAAGLATDARALHSATARFQLHRLSRLLERWPKHPEAAHARAELNDVLSVSATDNS